MKKIRTQLSLSTLVVLSVLVLSTSLLGTGCGDDATPADGGTADVPGTDVPSEDVIAIDGPGAQTLTINFAGMVGDVAFGCGTRFEGLGSGAVAADGADFRFFVSNIRLVNDAATEVPLALTPDGKWQLPEVALLDFEDGSGPCMMGNPDLNTTVVGTAPVGTYSGIRFDVGVPFALNHEAADTADPPLSATGMFWNWQGGHKFFRADLVNVEGGMGYNLHLGSTMCDSAGPMEAPTVECMRSNRVEVSLDAFDPTSDTIVANLAEALADADIAANTPMTPPGCQSFPADETDCGPVFPKLGLDFTTGAASGVQSLFSVQ